jgi:uncharacterized radical SAM superfamily Fe-S cluster-containing enzyme
MRYSYKRALDELINYAYAEGYEKVVLNHKGISFMNKKQVGEMLRVTSPTAQLLVKKFQEAGILKEITGFKRNRLFAFDEYLRLFDK